MAITQLQELRGKQNHLFDAYGKALEAAKTTDGSGDYNFDNLKEVNSEDVSSLNTVQKAEKLDALNSEISDLQPDIDKLAKAEEMAERLKRRNLTGSAHLGGEGAPKAAPSIGEIIVNSKALKAYRATGAKGSSVEQVGYSLKANFTTAAGFAPESLRTGRIQAAGIEPFSLIDLVPPGTTESASVAWMEETTHTNAAAERAENAAYAESAFVFTQRDATVRLIGHILPFTDEVIADTPRLMSELDLRMRSGLRERLNTQLASGNGTAPNLRGLRNVTGITAVTDKVAAATVLDYCYSLRKGVRTGGKTTANALLLGVDETQFIATAKTTDGIYLWGNPAVGQPQRLWGMIPVETEDLEANHGMALDTAYVQFFTKGGVDVQIGYNNDDFGDGRQSIRAGVRGALVSYRPTTIAYGGGLNT